MDTDLRNTRARLTKLVISAVIGGVLTFVAIKAMMSSGPSPNEDPVGGSSVALLAIAIFVATTFVAHKLLTRKRR